MPHADTIVAAEYRKNWKKKWRAANIAMGLRCDGKPRKPKKPLQTKEEKASYNKTFVKEWRSRPDVRERQNRLTNDYKTKRLKEDPEFKIKTNLRIALAKAITRVSGHKRGSHIELLGCTVEQLRDHLESQWLQGMSWENYGNSKGTWNIDHIRPFASFNLMNLEDLRKCCHYTNLQPMWAVDNYSKGDKY